MDNEDILICELCGFEQYTDDCECRTLYPGQFVDQRKEYHGTDKGR